MMEIRKAATLVVIRDGKAPNDGVEVLVIRRAKTMRFLPGFLAFPGGATCESDHHLAQSSIGMPMAAEDDEDQILAITALRETAEEIGWVCSVCERSQMVVYDAQLSPDQQASLCNDDSGLAKWMIERHLRFQLTKLRRVARFVTPPTQPIRFDTRFYLYHAHNVEEPHVHDSEVDSAVWLSVRATLQLVESREVPATGPTLALLQGLAKYPNSAAAAASLRVESPQPP
ncbi:NUDIX hydrolase [Alicyclobacillus acidocaldarius]|uniref:NUDIX hydrolase n=1 Tax=Alicyclobacillus acidocaldarius (strain Tc-4-1) TaxID=1048834 RepID=F8IGB5_ALIAT|nr:NUDIX hydrolase [Alicyclobacillus acidocaldarius]AEJ43011.1 NUDIX hydrolase [Alicyclobacillus acidocaldarius subsp. acidocaldarius Tc-4-1]